MQNPDIFLGNLNQQLQNNLKYEIINKGIQDIPILKNNFSQKLLEELYLHMEIEEY